jgi:Ca-activated chloride channel homolog
MRASAAAVLESVHGEVVVLEEVRAEASINDLLAEVTVAQRYRNPEDTNIEAVYTFPLPLDGVLLGFEVEIGDRKLVGTVVEKSDAERRYEDAITDGDAAVLLEQSEPGLYTASVGNLLPGETATIRFRYGLLLRWNGDRVRFMMPTTIAPRYGDPGAAGLAPHQSPEYAFDAERSFRLSLAVRGFLKDARFNSPSHGISVTPGSQETIIEIAGKPAMDRDFVLEGRASRSEVAGALLAPDLDGWLALASFRPEIPEGDQRERRSVKIVVDCSGSMGGDSITQARTALERILDGLREGDLFEIMAFGNSHRTLFGREMPVSETTLAQARPFVRALDADMGGTEIGAALDAACGIRGEADLSRDLLLITDGEVWNSDDVIARAKRSSHRIFTVGVGSAVAESFVRGLSEATGGACELVSPREDMAVRIYRHFQRMYAPRAKSATVRWPVSALRRMPDPIETVYGGDTVHVFAWFAEKPEGTVSLDVTLADGRAVSHETEVLPFEEGSMAAESEGASPSTLTRLGATHRLATMDNEMAATELAVRYQLMSEWTNYIVVHVRADAEKAEDLPKILKVPQVLAAGWHGMGTVFAEQRDVCAGPLYEIAPTPLPEAGFARRSMHEQLHEEKRLHEEERSQKGLQNMEVMRVVVIAPPELVDLLNARPMPPFPTLDEFEAWGLPESIVERLRDLVERGEDEEVVVLALLHLLSESEAGRMLERQVRRLILKAYKTHRPNEPLVNRMQDVFRSWGPSGGPPPRSQTNRGRGW